MLEVYTYNAGKGDCIRIKFAETHNIFIDTGVTRFAPKFEQICNKIIAANETLDALILTHVDDDHIGGILANLRNNSYKVLFKEVWMNHDGSASVGDIMLSTQQNNEVYARLIQRGVEVKPMVKGTHCEVAGAVIDIVCPKEIEVRAKKSRDTALAHHRDYCLTLSALANMPITQHDTSINNKNSIIFIFSYEGHRLLFTGDAWADDVVKTSGEFDLVKLPHHGSVRNIKEEYQHHIRSGNFLICTDGVNHPDKQTIAKLEKWYGEINIFSPSAWWKNGFFMPGDEEHKIKYYQKEGLVIAW